MEDAIERISSELQKVFINNHKNRYNKYTQEQIRTFIVLMQEEGMAMPTVAKQHMIPRSNA